MVEGTDGYLIMTKRVHNKIKRIYHLFSLTQLYLPSVIVYNTTCFGPRCGSSSGVTYSAYLPIN